MEKLDWKKDPELQIWLMDSTPAPKAVTGPKFDFLYKFVIRRKNDIQVKNFVPEWALDIVSRMLDADPDVRDYFCQLIYRGEK